ncbi:MAG: TRAM domain-containing protein [Syntrophaceae bacterium]|nr:TRAM domain-containing protein [Syntrophaceae bacterium]
MALSKTLSAVIIFCYIIFGGIIGFHAFGLSWQALGLVIGLALLLSFMTLRLLETWITLEVERVIGGAIGLAVGLALSIMLNSGLSQALDYSEILAAIFGLTVSIFSLIGIQLGSSKAKELRSKLKEPTGASKKIVGILDTSVIIDGRISDVCETGFLEGDLIIPQFVLKELQAIADSSESTKRTRGRRGLDILNKMKKQANVTIIINETDFPGIKEVDQKLISLAKETGHTILTNDFNLNKVAEVHSIQVLNINQLANALKPVVLPGETMRVQVLKEGKEANQGVAYLDDGTMVVVDNGKKFLGKTVDVTVTSVLQTTAGRMIFASNKTSIS